MSDKNKDGDFYRRPDKVRLWNSEKGELLGRNKESWGESSDIMEVYENSLVKINSKSIGMTTQQIRNSICSCIM